MTDSAFSKSDWENYARSYDGLNALSPYRALLGEVKEKLHMTSGERILDAACGTGNLTKLLCDTSSEDAPCMPNIEAVDYSTEMLERAREKCGTRAHVQKIDLNKQLPYERGCFDAIVSVNTLYALENPEAVLKEFARLLTIKGRLLLVTPKEGYQNGLILKAHCNSTKPDAYWENMHASAEREIMLIDEACGDNSVATSLQMIAACNREINANHAFHFFTRKDLCDIVRRVGFSVRYHGETYAKQCHLMILNINSTPGRVK